MRRWAEFVLTHRKLVVLFWIVVFVVGGSVSGAVSKKVTFDFSLPGQPGSNAAKKINQLFASGGYNAPYVLTVTLPAGQSVAEHADQVAATFNAVQTRVPQVRVVDQANTGDAAFTTSDGRTSYALVFYHYDNKTAKMPDAQVKQALEGAKPAGSTIGITGEDVLAKSQGSAGPGVATLSFIGGLGALLVLAFVFASLLALLPLVIAVVSIMASFLVLYPLTFVGHFSALVEYLIALVGLGVAIDYSLLVVTRWREERAAGRDNHDAVKAAMDTAGHAVLFSGITVAIGLLSLLVLPVPFLRSVGVGGFLIPLASVATTLSLTPAILGGIGPRVDWPRRKPKTLSRRWSSWAGAVVRGRWLAAGASLVLLAVLVGAFFTMRIGQSSTESLTKSGPAYQALQTLKSGGVPTGTLTPIEVLASSDQAKSVATALGKVDGVDRAVVATDPANNRDGKTVVVVIPSKETVNSKSIGTVKRVKSAAQNLPGVLGVTGVGAAQIDFLHGVYGNFPLTLTVIAVLTFILLVRAFRSLLLPLKAVLLNLVSLGATYGLLTLFWQDGHGSGLFDIAKTGAITFWIPLIVFAFLYGLSMDYEVFILARMREEYDRTGSTEQAVVGGMGRTGRLVTSAALILFLGFAAMAAGPGTDLKVMATALGFGILLDATIIRSLLVPALVSLFGSWNWYLPDGLARLLRVPASRPSPAAAEVGSVPPEPVSAR
ncbi:MAG TPA: MMPL family transporter [Jatrophihabitans sp.]|nr:MMPL family transporter [Jatrophihabitans sp.]